MRTLVQTIPKKDFEKIDKDDLESMGFFDNMLDKLKEIQILYIGTSIFVTEYIGIYENGGQCSGERIHSDSPLVIVVKGEFLGKSEQN